MNPSIEPVSKPNPEPGAEKTVYAGETTNGLEGPYYVKYADGYQLCYADAARNHERVHLGYFTDDEEVAKAKLQCRRLGFDEASLSERKDAMEKFLEKEIRETPLEKLIDQIMDFQLSVKL